MAVRGAPAIAIAGALGLAVDLHNAGAGKQFSTAQQASDHVQDKLTYLVTRYRHLKLIKILVYRVEISTYQSFAVLQQLFAQAT